MSNGGVVTISADRLLEIADKIKSVETELRQLGLNSFETQPATRAPQGQKSETEPMVIEFDVSNLDWTKSNRSGGGHAGPNEPWAWAFGYPDQNSPYPREECDRLVNAIIRYGEVRCGRYLVKLGGRDNRLLNRTIAK